MIKKQALFDFALKAFLLLSPVFFFKAEYLSFARGKFFLFGAFILFAVSLILEPKRRFSNPWVAAFLLWAFLRMPIAGYNAQEMHAQSWFTFWSPETASFLYIFAGVLLFYTIYCHAGDPRQYLTPIIIVCLMNFVLTAGQLSGHDFMWKHPKSICGFMETNTQLGQYSAMCLPLVAFISPWLTIVPIFMLFAPMTISPLVAAVAGAAFLCWKAKVRWLVLALSVLIAVAFLTKFFDVHYVFIRWKLRPVIWEKTLNVVLKRPYAGHGYRSFVRTVISSNVVGMMGSRDITRAHSDPLHAAQEGGFPMPILAGGFFFALWRKFKAKENKDKLTYFLAASVLIPLIICNGQMLIRSASIVGTFIPLLAFLSIKLEGEKDGYN